MKYRTTILKRTLNKINYCHPQVASFCSCQCQVDVGYVEDNLASYQDKEYIYTLSLMGLHRPPSSCNIHLLHFLKNIISNSAAFIVLRV